MSGRYVVITTNKQWMADALAPVIRKDFPDCTSVDEADHGLIQITVDADEYERWAATE